MPPKCYSSFSSPLFLLQLHMQSVIKPCRSPPLHRPGFTICLLDSSNSFTPSHHQLQHSYTPLQRTPSVHTLRWDLQIPHLGQLSKPLKWPCPPLQPPTPFAFLLLCSDYTQLLAFLRSGPEILPPSLKAYFNGIFFPFPISALNPL